MFEGFCPETVDFLWGIRMNNNRDWFTAHKKDYVNYLYEPMKALGKEAFRPYMERSGNILKVSRIYRDARMHHPLPYKECLWFSIRQDVSWWAENPGVYFEFSPEGVSYGFSLYRPSPATMEAFRQEIARDPDTFLQVLRQTEKATGVPVTAECYKRPKEAPIPELAPYFAWKGAIGCVVEEPVSEAVFGPELGQRVCDFLEKVIPIYEYFNRFKN